MKDDWLRWSPWLPACIMCQERSWLLPASTGLVRFHDYRCQVVMNRGHGGRLLSSGTEAWATCWVDSHTPAAHVHCSPLLCFTAWFSNNGAGENANVESIRDLAACCVLSTLMGASFSCVFISLVDTSFCSPVTYELCSLESMLSNGTLPLYSFLVHSVCSTALTSSCSLAFFHTSRLTKIAIA